MKKWYLEVRSGRAHWDKPIEELCGYYDTKKQAEKAAKDIEKCHPDYVADYWEE